LARQLAGTGGAARTEVVSKFLEHSDLTNDQRDAIAHGNAENIKPV
jgi:hypothetical protein